ncbi:methyl-accepting chemotaxis protein [Vibrio cholerae MAK 757]|nr:methyl-accepting chemotaxis protein [Vibrio cholerae MAK 757]
MRIIRHYVTGSLWQNDPASCPRSAASEAVSAGAMVLTTSPQHNDVPHNAHLKIASLWAS